MLLYAFIYFLGIFLLFFFKKIWVFIIFISFFDEVTVKFLEQNINQSETGIGGPRLSGELYVHFSGINTVV